MSNENKQPDERAAFEGYSKSSIGKNLTRRDNWYSNEMPETREEVARDAFRAGFRATQQATKGDGRAALDVEILSGPCVNVCVTQDSKPKDQRFDVVVIRKTDFDKLTSARTTPSPVAGSAGQAPIAYYTDWPGHRVYAATPHGWDEPGLQLSGDSIADEWHPLYAALTAPSLTTDAGAVRPRSGGQISR